MYIAAALRRLVYARANGCCEYCYMPETAVFATHEIDHIIAQKHGGPTVADNLALSCALCNKYKGSDLTSLDPETGRVVPLYHPRQSHWPEHFQGQDGRIVPRTPTGRVTIRLLQLNHPDRVGERTLLIATKLLCFPE